MSPTAGYYASHRDEIRADQAKYYVDNRDEILLRHADNRVASEGALRESRSKRRVRLREWLHLLRTDKGCEDCGTREGRLYHHHIDPATKRYKVSGMYSCSQETLLAELAKCAVLCASCHQNRHLAMRAVAA